MPGKVLDKITYPFSNVIGATVKVDNELMISSRSS